MAKFFPFLSLLDLANAVTTINIIISIATVMSAQSGRFDLAAALICTAAVIDFVDGYIARKFLYSSHKCRDFGKQLDSLADLLNFSVAPAITVWAMSPTIGSATIGGLLIVSGCLRLALFSALTPSSRGYVGLPTTYSGVLLGISTLAYSYGIVPVNAIAALTIAIAVIQVSHLHFPKIGIIGAVIGIPTSFTICAFAFQIIRSFAS